MSAIDPCLLGIDGGTESLRAALFDLDGVLIASAATPYETRFPQPAWAEQDPRAGPDDASAAGGGCSRGTGDRNAFGTRTARAAATRRASATQAARSDTHPTCRNPSGASAAEIRRVIVCITDNNRYSF